MLYNTQFITDRVILNVTIGAEDRDHAHSRALSVIYDDLNLNLIPIRYQFEAEVLEEN
jgi:hypothetical protein